ncbi:MAG: hypothetical protein J2O49_08830, partial [Sciscionella sp.]|nr:hypothetical protein [Sciscionella sp.]
MTGPYPPQGGDPRQWAQPAPGDQPEQTQRLTSGGFPAQQPPPSGGFPAQPPSQPGGFPAQPGYQQPYQQPGGH